MLTIDPQEKKLSRPLPSSLLKEVFPKPHHKVVPEIMSLPQVTPPPVPPARRMFNEDTLDNLKTRVGQGLPKLIIPGAAVSPEGYLAYSTSTKQLYYSDGSQWNEVTGTATFTNLTVTNHLTVGNLATLNNVTVSGSATMNSLGVTNGIISGSLSVTNGATLGNLTVSGTSSLNSLGVTNGLAAGNLTVSGTSSLNSASVTNGLTAGSLTSNTLTATNTLSVTNGATVGSLTVNNGETISGGLTVDTLTVTSMRVVTGVTNVLSTDSLLLCNTSGGGVTLNLPAGTKGMSFVISDIGRAYGSSGSSTNNITLVPNGSDIFVINNGSSVTGNYVFGLDGAQSKVTYIPSAVSGLGVGVWRIMPETGVAPYNLTVFVSTGGSDSNNGLAVGTPVLTLQQALNIVSAIGWENTCTVSLGSGTFNTPNLQIPKSVYGKQTYPMTIQGTLTTVYSGTINTITNTYASMAGTIPDQTSTISYNVTVGASSGNGVLRGDFLRVTSSVGTANQIGFLINDNTQNSPTTETYVMCSYPQGGDLVLSTQPAAAAGDTFTVFTRGTTLNFNDATRAQIIGNDRITWFKDINFTISANGALKMQFLTGVYLFTDTQFSCNSTTNGYIFERGTKIITGRDIILANPSSNLGAIDVAGIHCVPTVVTTMSINIFSAMNNNVTGSVFRQTTLQVGSDNAVCCVFSSQFPDGLLSTSNAIVNLTVLLFTASSALSYATSILLQGSLITANNLYCVATSPPGGKAGIIINNATDANFGSVSATGYSVGLTVSTGVFSLSAGSNNFSSNTNIGLQLTNGSVSTIAGTALTCNSCTNGISMGGGITSTISPTTLTCNNNTTNGITVANGAQLLINCGSGTCNNNAFGLNFSNGCEISVQNVTCTGNSTNGIQILNASQVVFLAGCSASTNGGTGVSIIGSASVTFSGTFTASSNTNGGVTADGLDAFGAVINISSPFTCSGNSRNGMYFENCVVFINTTITANSNGNDGIKCTSGTRFDNTSALQTTGGAGNNNGAYGLECLGSTVFTTPAANSITGNTANVKVGSNTGVTWATITANAAANTSDYGTANPAYSIVHTRLT